MRSLRKFAGTHPPEQIQILFHTALSPRAFFSWLCQCSSILLHLLRSQIIHIRQPLLDQDLCKLIQLIVIFRCIEQVVPLKSHPADIFHDGIHILRIFLSGIRIVKAQIASAAVLGRSPKVNADGFDMTDMHISIGLWREPRHHLGVYALRQIFVNFSFDKIICLRQIRALFVVYHESLLLFLILHMTT